MKSIQEVGLLHPIIVDLDNRLIAGAHRLEACRRLGWLEIECNVVSLSGLRAELAEIDENLVRRSLNHIDEDNQLLRRKEIYEALYPETRHNAYFKGNQHVSSDDAASSDQPKSFVDDTAEKMGVTPRTVSRKIQIAKDLAPEVQKIVKEHDLTEKTAEKLSRLEPEQQRKAAGLLAAKKIKRVEEYTAQQVPEENPKPEPPPSNIRVFRSLKESIADMKDTEKDRTATTETLLMEFEGFVRETAAAVIQYASPSYDRAYQEMSPAQADRLIAVCDTLNAATDQIILRAERKQRHGKAKKA